MAPAPTSQGAGFLDRHRLFWGLAAFLCGFGLGAFSLLGRLCPFPAAVAAITCVDRNRHGRRSHWSRWDQWAAVVGIVAGMGARSGLLGCLMGAAPMSLIWLLLGYYQPGEVRDPRPQRPLRMRAAVLSAVTGAAAVLAKVPMALLTQSGLDPTCLIAEAGLSACFVYMLAQSRGARSILQGRAVSLASPGRGAADPGAIQRGNQDNLYLGLMLCAAASGLDVIRVGPVRLGLVCCSLITVVGSLAGGAYLGAVSGTAVGLVSWLSSPAAGWRLGGLALTGLLVGAAVDLRLGFFGMGAAAAAAWALSSARIASPGDILGFALALLAALVGARAARGLVSSAAARSGWAGSRAMGTAPGGLVWPRLRLPRGRRAAVAERAGQAGRAEPAEPAGRAELFDAEEARAPGASHVSSEHVVKALSRLARSLDWAVQVGLAGSVSIPRPLTSRATESGESEPRRATAVTGVDGYPPPICGGPSRGAQASPASPAGSLVGKVAARLCSGCSSQPACWGRHLVRTQACVIDAAAWVELRAGERGRPRVPGVPGVPGTEQDETENEGSARTLPRRDPFSWCLRGQRILPTVRAVLESGIEGGAQPPAVLAASTASEDLGLFVSVLRALSTRLSADRTERFDLAMRLELRLVRAGLEPARVRVVADGGGLAGAEVTLARCPCSTGRGNVCRAVVALVAAEVLGRRLEAWPGDCPLEAAPAPAGQPGCSFTLRRYRRYELELAVRKVARANGAISGDSHVCQELSDGRVVVALSDGMGTGPAAAIESGTALALLSRLIESGFEAQHAVRIVNSLVAARGGGERFVTLDLAVIDLNSGEAELVKVGCCPSFLVGRRGVAVESGQGLPVGITSSIRVEITRRTMADQEYLVMVSDGALGGAPAGPQESTVERLARDLAAWRSQGADEVAARIMSRVRSGEPPQDDITVMVARLVSRNGSRNAQTAG